MERSSMQGFSDIVGGCVALNKYTKKESYCKMRDILLIYQYFKLAKKLKYYQIL